MEICIYQYDASMDEHCQNVPYGLKHSIEQVILYTFY